VFCYRLGRFLVTRKGNRPNPTEFSGESNLRVKNPAGSNSAPELPDRRASSEGGRLPLRGAAAPRHRCGSRPGAVRPPPGIERRRPSPRSRPVPGTATIRKRRSVRQSPKLELVPASQINCISMGSCREYSGKCMHWFFRKRTDINETCTCPSFYFLFLPCAVRPTVGGSAPAPGSSRPTEFRCGPFPPLLGPVAAALVAVASPCPSSENPNSTTAKLRSG